MSKRRKRSNISSPWKRYMTILVVVISIVIWYILKSDDQPCNPFWNHTDLIRNLSTNIVGQDYVINQLDSTLHNLPLTAPAFYTVTGNVGVGKSLFVNIIMNNFPWSQQAVKVTAKDLPFESFSKMSSLCAWNLLIVEDCNSDNYIATLEIVEGLIMRAIKQKIKLIIFVVYTARENEDLANFNTWASKIIYCVDLPFNPLSRDVIKDCFEKDLKNYNINLGEYDLEKMVDEYLEENKGAGCKQVHTKVMTHRTKNDYY